MCNISQGIREEAAREAAQEATEKTRIQTFADAVNGIKMMFGVSDDKAIEAANVPSDIRAAVKAAL